MSNSWFYSKVAESGSSEKVGHGNMTVLSEEAEARFDRECEVGDIRVGFDTEAMPIGVTVVAEQQDYRLMPIREEGQPVYILLAGRGAWIRGEEDGTAIAVVAVPVWRVCVCGNAVSLR